MNVCKKMNEQEFANYLITLKTNDCFSFGCTCESENDSNYSDCDLYDTTDISDWYFCKVVSIPEFESRFILLDYSGGEEAFAIPVNSYSNKCDEDDEYIIKEYIHEYFKKGNRFLYGNNDSVYVEIE